MKQKILLTIIVIAFLIGIYLIFNYTSNNPKIIVRKPLENVTMNIKKGTLTNKGATIIITDLNEEKCPFSDIYYIEKYENNKWVRLKEIAENVFSDLVEYKAGQNNTLEFEINWEPIYGKLNKGKYRLVKISSLIKNGEQLEDRYIYTEFTIEETSNLSLEEKLYKKVNPSEEYTLLKYLYTNNNSFDNNYIIAVGISNYIDKNNNTEKIKKEDVDTNIKEIFGNNIKYNHQKVYIYKENYCGFEFNETKKEYTALHGCDGDMFHKLYRKVVDTKTSNNTIEIYEKLIFAEWSSDFKELTIFNNNIDKKVIKKLDGNNSINIDDYLNDATTYKYTFEKVNDNYIFKSLTKENE